MIYKIWARCLQFIGHINWEKITELFCTSYYGLTVEDHQAILDTLEKGNYIILTRRKSHLSTYLENIAHFFLTGRMGYWSHACMNVEFAKENLLDHAIILEAVGEGVKETTFAKTFNCDSVCILRPVMNEGIDWETVVEHGLSQLGKKYDTLFNIYDSKAFSCIELVLFCLSFIPNYEKLFHGLVAMVKLEKNIDPDMLVECGSFEVVLEIRRSLKWRFFRS